MRNFYMMRGVNGSMLECSLCSYANLSSISSGQSESSGHHIPSGFSHVKTDASGPKLANIHSKIAPFNGMYKESTLDMH